MLSRPGERAFHEERRQVDAGGDAVVARFEVIPGRRVARPVVARRHLVEERSRHLVPGQDVVGGDEVVVIAVRQRADHGVLVGPRREQRQMLADVQSRHRGGDRLELAADLGGRVRLRIEHVQVAGRPGQEHDDDRLRLAPGRRRVGGDAASDARPRPRKPEAPACSHERRVSIAGLPTGGIGVVSQAKGVGGANRDGGRTRTRRPALGPE